LLSPEEVFSLMAQLHSPVNTAVLLVAATGVRISECLGLRWRHVKWNENKIFIQQVFRRGEIVNRTKTKASKAPVPMCEALAAMLTELRRQSPYNADEDFVFASPYLEGKQPLWGQTMNAKFIKPATLQLGLVAEGERFGWHRCATV
jgi:integrase